MAKPTTPEPQSFSTIAALHEWLKDNHDRQTELWIRIFKKDSRIATVSWNDCVMAALTWGWIDGHKKSLDDISFLQRLTPRRKRSNWSKRNCAHAESLIAQGIMQAPGLAQVVAAKSDGRWGTAYAGSADMEIPDDFVQALNKSTPAKTFYATLNRANQFAIYHRLQTARNSRTRAARIARMVAQLAEGKSLH